MSLFKIGIATEANNYQEDVKDQIWIKTEDGKFVLVEDDKNESNSK